jgi:hypothetical protein
MIFQVIRLTNLEKLTIIHINSKLYGCYIQVYHIKLLIILDNNQS